MQTNRRDFTRLGVAGLAATTLAGAQAATAKPWYDRVRRWGQINITEDNAADMDVGFWRDYWRKTDTQGMILNAGGYVAYYPTKIPFHRRAASLGDRDLFGELARACREDGVTLVARLSYFASEEQLKAHPEWANVDARGNRLKSACMNGGFIYDYCPLIVREVVTNYRPAGISLSGWGTNYGLCYCDVCKRLFREKTGHDLPAAKDWDDPVYRAWVTWNSDQVMALWDLHNKVAQAAGGPDCLWMGQIIGSMGARDMKRICERSRLVMMDHQSRSDDTGFQENADAGKLVHDLLGWNKNAAAAQAIYNPRLASKPAPEAQLWMYEGMAGGLTPWWHTISAYHEDKRRYATTAPVFNWHKANEQYLYDRVPVATVGVVWCDSNNVFYGRDDTRERVRNPWRGMVEALIRARIPYVALHADHIDREAAGLSTLVLPNVAAMTDAQIASVRRFVARGGGLLATGESSLCDGFGDRRPDYALADLFGAHWLPAPAASAADAASPFGGVDISNLLAAAGLSMADIAATGMTSSQTYLRLTPELRRNVAGPHNAAEPLVAPGAARHPALKGFDQTDIIFFGGKLNPLRVDAGAQVLLTYIPPSPTLPAENAWMRVPRTDIPALIANTAPGGGRVAFLPADLDRQYAKDNYPDQADLLANLVRWTAKDNVPLAVEGPGLIDSNLYRQPGRMVLHLANLNAGTWRAPLEEFIPVGPVTVRVKLASDVPGTSARLLVAGQSASVSVSDGWAQVHIPTVLAHEVVVIA